MTIYWERCSICGRHYPTKTCWLHPELNVCPHCCLLCPERSICPNPAWFPNLKLEAPVVAGVEAEAKPSPPRPAAAAVAEKRVEARRRETAEKRITGREAERKEKIRKLEELLRRLGGE